jgi:hypothetical protein
MHLWRAWQQAQHSPSKNMSPVLAGTEFKIDCIHLNELAGMCQTPRIVLQRRRMRAAKESMYNIFPLNATYVAYTSYFGVYWIL